MTAVAPVLPGPAAAIPAVQLLPWKKEGKGDQRSQRGSAQSGTRSQFTVVQAAGTVQHKLITGKFVLDHSFPYHDPVRGPRWKPCRDDVLDDALRTSEGEGSNPMQQLRHQNFMRGYRHLMPGAIVEQGPGKDDFERPLPPKRRVKEPGEAGAATHVVL